MCFQVPPEDYDSITDLVTTEEVTTTYSDSIPNTIVQAHPESLTILSQTRRDAKDVLLAVMGQADTLARLEFASLSLNLTSEIIHDHLAILTIILSRCVNDCLRVSEEKEVVSEGAAGGSRFVPDQ